MKRKIFALGLLSIGASMNAQALLSVSDQAGVYIKESALVYNGGEVKTKASGLVDNFGNVMIVGGGLKTVTATNTNKTDGGNFILRLWADPAAANGALSNGGTNLKYGQLYINGTTQAQVTGIVDKEYKENNHGAYQQIAIPFYQKTFASLSDELGAFGNVRNNRAGVLVWNNKRVEFDHIIPSTSSTNAINPAKAGIVVDTENLGATTYYAVGTRNFNAFTGGKTNTLGTNVFTIKGVPYASSNITGKLTGAGDGLDFGSTGSNRNSYSERYRTYLGDHFVTPVWTGAGYGKNIYQFGNPYLTNISLRHLNIPNLVGARVQPGISVPGTGVNGGETYITYVSGVATGDVKDAIIRPLGTFELKLSAGSSTPISFDDLRKFAYEASSAATFTPGVTTQSVGNVSSLSKTTTSKSNKLGSTVKQLGVLALDKNGKEIGRTYYVVYANGVSGQPTSYSAQVISNSKNVIGTFEETKSGGVDENLVNTYWLYINEANETDYKGKQIPLRLYSNEIKSLKFEILENAEDIADGQERLSSGESFYVFDGKNYVAAGNNKSITVSSTDADFGLYYGRPVDTKTSATSVALDKPSATVLAYDESVSAYRLMFDPEWKTATVQVFDMSGRLISTHSNVDASNSFVVSLPNAIKANFVVTAVSETGKKFSQKVVNK